MLPHNRTMRIRCCAAATPATVAAILQNELIEAGFKVLPDGDFGEITEQAVRTFQARQGLKDDGVVGRATWDALQGELRDIATSASCRSSPPAAHPGHVGTRFTSGLCADDSAAHSCRRTERPTASRCSSGLKLSVRVAHFLAGAALYFVLSATAEARPARCVTTDGRKLPLRLSRDRPRTEDFQISAPGKPTYILTIDQKDVAFGFVNLGGRNPAACRPLLASAGSDGAAG